MAAPPDSGSRAPLPGGDAADQLDQFKQELIRIRSTREVCEIVAEFLQRRLGAGDAGIYLWNEADGAFSIWPERSDKAARLRVFDPYLLHATEDERILFADELEGSDLPADVRQDAARILRETGGDALVPLVLNQSLVALVFVGRLPETTDNAGVRALVDEVRSLAVMALSNSILYARLEGILSHLEEKVRERTRELEQAQSQLVQQEKMAMLGVMAAGIAHEINTPSGVIQGGVDNIERNLQHILGQLGHIRHALAPQRQEPFYDFLQRAGEELASGADGRRVRDAFRRKRELGARLESLALPFARDFAALFVENGLFAPGPDDSPDERLEVFLASPLMQALEGAAGSGASTEEARFVLKYATEVLNCARNLRNIRGSIRNVVRIVRALKHYSHLDQGEMDEADLHDGIENTLIIMHNLMKHDVEIDRDYGAVPPIVCNPDELGQVWTNLLSNAYHALRGRSDARIIVRTRYVPAERARELGVASGLSPSGEEVGAARVEIRDNGPGIPPQILSKIWDPFFTTKDQGEGSGLGLGIVKGIVEKHRGRITADSRPDAGAVFAVTLPLRPPPQPESSEERRRGAERRLAERRSRGQASDASEDSP